MPRALLGPHGQGSEELPHVALVQMICAQVGGVVLAPALVQGECTFTETFLDPQLADCQVSDIADPAPGADALGCGRIRMEPKPQRQAQVERHALKP